MSDPSDQLPAQPSEEYLEAVGIGPRDPIRLDQMSMARHAWREKANEWIRAHAVSVQPTRADVDAWAQANRSERWQDDPAGVRWWWETRGLIAYGLGDDWLWRPTEAPPSYVLAAVAAEPAPAHPDGETPSAPATDRPLGPTAESPGYEMVRGILAAMQTENERWQMSETGAPTFRWVSETGAISTSIQRPNNRQTADPGVQTDLWAIARALGDRDGDVLLTALAHALSGYGRMDDGSVVLTTDAILDFRDRVPKTRRLPGGSYVLSSHRTRDRTTVAECMRRLDHVYVSLHRKGTRKRSIVYESKVLLILGRMVQEGIDGEDRVILGWRYRIGDWLDPATMASGPQLAGLLYKAVGYDPLRQVFEKRLAHFIVLYGCVDTRQERHLTMTVGDLLDNAQLSDEGDPARPGEIRRRFERALDQLHADAVIMDVVAGDGTVQESAWAYSAEGQAVLEQLPRYDWLAQWRGATVRFTLPATATPRLIGIATPRPRGRPRKDADGIHQRGARQLPLLAEPGAT